MTSLIVGVLVCLIMGVLLVMFIMGVSVFDEVDEEGDVCSEPMAECASCHKC